MSDPDVRVVVQGLAAAERRIEQLLLQRERAQRMAEEVRRRLAKIDQDLEQLARALRRSPN